MTKAPTDISTLFGIVTALSLVAAAIMLEGNLLAFFDLPSLLVVLGGTFFLTLSCYSFQEILHTHMVLLTAIFKGTDDPTKSATLALELAEIVRKKGTLDLQHHKAMLKKHPFLQRAATMLADGAPHHEIESVLSSQISAMRERHQQSQSVLRKAAETAPAMGLIGTLIGLVQMLGGLNDPTTIGPAMALALLTTLYGAILAYMVFGPLAAKLERNSRTEALVQSIFMKTMVSIGKQENPRRLEMLINALLPPGQRVNYFT